MHVIISAYKLLQGNFEYVTDKIVYLYSYVS